MIFIFYTFQTQFIEEKGADTIPVGGVMRTKEDRNREKSQLCSQAIASIHKTLCGSFLARLAVPSFYPLEKAVGKYSFERIKGNCGSFSSLVRE